MFCTKTITHLINLFEERLEDAKNGKIKHYKNPFEYFLLEYPHDITSDFVSGYQHALKVTLSKLLLMNGINYFQDNPLLPEKEKMKECLFCGSSVFLREWPEKLLIQCKKCDLILFPLSGENKHAFIARWNKRR